jgi:hypothetical protein
MSFPDPNNDNDLYGESDYDDGGVRPMDTSDDTVPNANSDMINTSQTSADVLHTILTQCNEPNSMPILNLSRETDTGNGTNTASVEQIRGRTFFVAKRNNAQPRPSVQQPPQQPQIVQSQSRQMDNLANPMNLWFNPMNV